MKSKNKEDPNNISLLPEGSILNGESLIVPSDLRISGRVSLNVESDGKLVIDHNATVSADIKAEDLVIHGSVNGNIWVKKQVLITHKAVVNGYLSSDKIRVEEGAHCSFQLNVEPGAVQRHNEARLGVARPEKARVNGLSPITSSASTSNPAKVDQLAETETAALPKSNSHSEPNGSKRLTESVPVNGKKSDSNKITSSKDRNGRKDPVNPADDFVTDRFW